MPVDVDGSLSDWASIESRLDLDESGILLGNGASMAISPSLSHPALFRVSCDDKYPDHLGEAERRVFDEFGTKNFEEILFNLRIARRNLLLLSFA